MLSVIVVLFASSIVFAEDLGMKLGCNPGTMECVGDAEYHVCNSRALWDPAVSCLSGQHCVDGKCEGLPPQCSQFQQTRCSPDDIKEIQICNAQFQWENFKFCDFGCLNGYCNACQFGQKRCISKHDYQTCNGDGQWVGDQTCGTDYYCDGPGNCILSPDVRCENIGSYRCAPGNSNTLQRCGDNYHWSDFTHCPMGCASSACKACNTGQSKCQDAATVIYCSDQGQWGSATSCPDGYLCSSGSCQVPAGSQCSAAGQKRCSPDDQKMVQVCGSNYIYADSVECSDGCYNGVCAECKPGATMCAGATTYRVCTQNGQLSGPKKCPAGYTCENGGECVATPQCSEGLRTCVSDSIYYCQNGNWTLLIHCPSNTDCVEGSGTAYCSPEQAVSTQNQSSQQAGGQQAGDGSQEQAQPSKETGSEPNEFGSSGIIFVGTTVVLILIVFYLMTRKKE